MEQRRVRMRRVVRLAAAAALVALGVPGGLLAQERTGTVVTGAVTVTNKGISTVPSFTLGKPAAVFDVSIARRGLSFDPQFRFGLDGRPWSFLFWGRYKLVEGEKLNVTVGAHPALSFRTIPVVTNGVSRDVITARRYLATELAPTYALSNDVSVGLYHLYSYGVERDVAKHTNFLALRGSLTNVRLPEQLSLRFDPQVYYLRTDALDGFYLYAGATLAGRGLPLSLSTVVNRPIRSNVVGGGEFLWNVSARYAIR
jgi:hypothetical protein